MRAGDSGRGEMKTGDDSDGLPPRKRGWRGGGQEVHVPLFIAERRGQGDDRWACTWVREESCSRAGRWLTATSCGMQ
jgi:hypothetical protein